MLIGESFIYLELLKTASSHTRKALEGISTLKSTSIGKHTSLNDLEDLKLLDGKKLIGNIRNPWDWYVSHWAFGCMGRGGLHKRLSNHTLKHIFRSPALVVSQLSRFKTNQHVLKNYYSNSESKEQFKKWLHFVLFSPTYDVEHDYYTNKSYQNLGLYSYEYLKMYTSPEKVETVLTEELALSNIKSHLLDIHYIHTENLEQDLIHLSSILGVSEQSIQNSLSQLSRKTNSSSRKNYQDYYDDESREWIAEKDRLITELHHYTF